MLVRYLNIFILQILQEQGAIAPRIEYKGKRTSLTATRTLKVLDRVGIVNMNPHHDQLQTSTRLVTPGDLTPSIEYF